MHCSCFELNHRSLFGVLDVKGPSSAKKPKVVAKHTRGVRRQEKSKGVTLWRYSHHMGLFKRKAAKKTAARSKAEAEIRNQITFLFLLWWLFFPHDRMENVFTLSADDQPKNTPLYKMSARNVWNHDSSTLVLNHEEDRVVVYLTHEADAVLRQAKRPVAKKSSGPPAKIFRTRWYALFNADGYVADPLLIIKDENVAAGTIIKMVIPGMHHHQDKGQGHVWIVNNSHGEQAEGVFGEYLDQMVLPEISKTRQQVESKARPANPSKKPERAVFMLDGEREHLNATQSRLSKFIEIICDVLKLSASCTALQQAWDRSLCFKLMKELLSSGQHDQELPEDFLIALDEILAAVQLEHPEISADTLKHIRELVPRFSAALPYALKPQYVLGGWSDSGVWPLDSRLLLQQTRDASVSLVEDSLDGINNLINIAPQYSLTEAQMNEAGIPKAEQKTHTPLNEKALIHQRATLITHETWQKRVTEKVAQDEKYRKALQEVKAENERRKAMSEEEKQEEREKSVKSLVEKRQATQKAEREAALREELAERAALMYAAKSDALKVLEATKPHLRLERAPKDDEQCPICCRWYYTWKRVEENLKVPPLKWTLCKHCKRWWCPFCLPEELLTQVHEGPCALARRSHQVDDHQPPEEAPLPVQKKPKTATNRKTGKRHRYT